MFPDNDERRFLITINGGHALTVLRGPAPQLWPMLLTNGSGSVDVRRWVGDGEIPGVLVRTHQIAAFDGH